MSGERLITGPFVRVWLGTFAGFAWFGFVLLTLPLYVHDESTAAASRSGSRSGRRASRPSSSGRRRGGSRTGAGGGR